MYVQYKNNNGDNELGTLVQRESLTYFIYLKPIALLKWWRSFST